MNNDHDKLNTAEDQMSDGEELISAALQDEAGREAIEAQELQEDEAPINDAALTGEMDSEEELDSTIDESQLEDQAVTVSEVPSLVTDAPEMPVEEEEAPAVVVDDNPNARWYVVHTYSGHENKVAATLKQKVASEHLEAFILDVLVPTQDKIEIRNGKKEAVKEKIFPGYILVRLVLTDESWLAVRTTPGVTSFVGIGNKPTPIPESEVKTIVKFMTQGAAPTFKDVFLVNDTVKIIEGPFAQFIGKVDSVDKDRGKVKVLVSIFGRETPVELDFLQVTKL